VTAGTATRMVAGVDIGGTKTLAVAVAPDGSIAGTVRQPTSADTPDELLGSTRRLLLTLAASTGNAEVGFEAIGVGIPGLIDRATGTVRHAVNLGLGDQPVELAAGLRNSMRTEVVVDNDVNVAAVGAGAVLGRPGDLAYLSVGTGIAAGFLLDGRIRRGAHGAAGEIGHISVDPTGPHCECGQRGCLETVASGSAILERQSVGDEVAGHLAWAVAVIAQTVDPQTIVLGGGVIDALPELVDAVRSTLRARAAASPMLAALNLADRVAVVPAGVPAGALGAALLARQTITADV